MKKEELYELVTEDYEGYASHFLKIKGKNGLILPFIFNEAQKKVHRIVEETKRLGKPLRFIVLKARQEGVSTYFAGRVFHRTANRYNRKASIVGHETKSANNLLEMAERFYNYLPDGLKPKVGHSNEKKLSFSVLESEMLISSADSGGGLERSATYQDILATETAFWRDAKSSLNALLQTVADDTETMVVLESTANGIGDEFYDRWVSAKEGKSDFTPIFLAWFDLPEYTKNFESKEAREAFEKTLTDEDKNYQTIYSLTLEQMYWRSKTIENKCGGDKDLFRQEYPASDKEAFLVSGRPVFDVQIVYKRYEESKEPIKVGFLEYVDEKQEKVKFVENRGGYVKIFNDLDLHPSSNRFASGTDVAEGLAQGDYSVFPVLDRITNKFSLVWHGHIEPDLLAEEMHKVSLFLNKDVWFLVERNNHGLTTITRARQLGLKLMYEGKFDSGYEVPTDKIGMKTQSGDNFSTSKTILINSLEQAIRDNHFECLDKDFWAECLTFVRNPKGGMSAQGKDKDPSTKTYDDRVMAWALAWRCHSWLPQYKDKRTTQKVYKDVQEFKDETIFKHYRKRRVKKVYADSI